MGQSDIFAILKDLRLSGNSGYFSAEQIRRMLIERGCSSEHKSVYNDISMMRIVGWLDVKVRARKTRRSKYAYSVYRLKSELV